MCESAWFDLFIYFFVLTPARWLRAAVALSHTMLFREIYFCLVWIANLPISYKYNKSQNRKKMHCDPNHPIEADNNLKVTRTVRENKSYAPTHCRIHFEIYALVENSPNPVAYERNEIAFAYTKITIFTSFLRFRFVHSFFSTTNNSRAVCFICFERCTSYKRLLYI